jgi:hypothetical protein
MKRFIAIRVTLFLLTPLTTPQAQAHMPKAQEISCATGHLSATDSASRG